VVYAATLEQKSLPTEFFDKTVFPTIGMIVNCSYELCAALLDQVEAD
jgi:hypothetical protein